MSGVYLLSEINEYGASDRVCKDKTDFTKKNRMNEDCLILYKVVCESRLDSIILSRYGQNIRFTRIIIQISVYSLWRNTEKKCRV